MNVELYIANTLCDLGSTDLKVALKRQFINPAQLNSKDAQKSYAITLPATPVNNKIFGYANVEEVIDKFNIYPDARLYVGGVLILEGKFMLTEITRKGYKGNLGVPKKTEIKDIFGETTMAQAGAWKVDFFGFTDISRYNNADNPECIFPLVLYGLLPKVPEGTRYSPKDVYDSTVRLGLDDFPPSVNVLQMLTKIFSNAGYNLSGTALNDERLRNLYVSYKNPNDYELDWGVGRMTIHGEWRAVNETIESKYRIMDNDDNGRRRFIVNLFDADNNTTNLIYDKGSNISKEGNRIYFTVPVTGLYKVNLNVRIQMVDQIAGNDDIYASTSDLNAVNTEVKLIRNFDGDLTTLTFDNTFYKDNQPFDIGDPNALFPRENEVNFIDPLQNKDIINGFSFGRHTDEAFRNPLVSTGFCNPMAALGGRSWSADRQDTGTNERNYSATQSSGYAYADGINTRRYRVELNKQTYTRKTDDRNAEGDINQVMWLERGDTLDIVGVSFCDVFSNPVGSNFRMYNHNINYILTLEPFRRSMAWLQMDDEGTGTAPMDWNDPSDFNENSIDLVKFLPSEIKVNDWIDNFCKAFNLRLESVGDNRFELNIKSTRIVENTSYVIDLDSKANVHQRVNQPLNIPSVYDLGFTIDNNEEGYVQDMKLNDEGERILNTGPTGGGKFYTGSYYQSETVSQTSNFSYNWFKVLKDADGYELARVPVISDHDVWENDYDYEDMLGKTYFDKAQRFWYKSGVMPFVLNTGVSIDVAIVSNAYNGTESLTLDYYDMPDTILSSYFLLWTNRRDFTVVDCFLSPDEYARMPYSFVRFNGDLYIIAEIDGYDPLGRHSGTMKLIRKTKGS